MKRVINQETMRSTNKHSILDFIQRKGPIAKPEIANRLGLSATSVSTFINELLSEDTIIPCGNAKSTGGRKSTLYQVNPNAFFSIGMDLQVDRIIALLLNFNNECIDKWEISLETTDEWAVVDKLRQLIPSILAKNNLPLKKLTGVGIGVPGIVNGENGLIEFAPNLGWKNVNLHQALGLDCPVTVENEANAAALGERSFGNAKLIGNLVYVSIGMGVGCGLILNGRLFAGQTYHAGEFGHMTIDPQGLLCRCGNKGCWECYTSNQAVLALYTQKTGKALSSFREFIEHIHDNDSEAVSVLEQTTRYLGLGLANIANGLNPEMVVIGGEIAELRDLIINPLLRQVKDLCLDKTFSGLTIEFSRLGNQAAALGMAELMIRQTLQGGFRA